MSGISPDVFAAQQLDGYDLLAGDLDVAGVEDWQLHSADEPVTILVRLADGRRFTLKAEEQ